MLAASAMAEDWPQWNGPNRDNKSTETGLLKEWPGNGPKELWSYDELGMGYSTVAVVDGTIYTTGLEDGKLVVYALDTAGKLKWKKRCGHGWTGGYPGARPTPTIDDGKLYVMGAHALVVCLDAKSGDEVWQQDLKKKYDAKNIHWGITESLLVGKDKLICTPGGNKAAIVALDKGSGKEIWSSTIGEKSAYCSPKVVEHNKIPMLLTGLSKSFVGVNASTGDLLWKYTRNPKYGIHAVEPLYLDGMVFCSSAYGRGSEMIVVDKDGKGYSGPKWTTKDIACHHGGLVEHEGIIYGSSDRGWASIDFESGKTIDKQGLVGKGSLAYAEGHLYLYGERGKLALVAIDKGRFSLKSQFQIRKGQAQHWAHPVVCGGVLYVRHGSVLMAFDIKG